MSKRKFVTFNTKLDIVSALDEGKSIRVVASEIGVSKGTVQAVKKNRLTILAEAESNRSLTRGRIVVQSTLNILIWRWFALARMHGFPISGPILQARALELSGKLGISNFKASEGWLDKWKKRNNVRSYIISGESGNIDLVTAENWKRSISTLIAGYDLENVFNMDETGFFRCLPDSTLSHVSESCKGGKQGKNRLTVVLTCSALGEKLKPMIIGKSKNPRCFRGSNLSTLHAEYYSSVKAWMTNPLFNKYLLKLNRFFQERNRKILLFLDNAPVHIVDDNTESFLTHVKLIFFPPNLTSVLQPLDGGIIRSLKAQARRLQVLHMIEEMEGCDGHASDLVKKLSVLDAMKFVSAAWNLINKETITKCFNNCGFGAEVEGNFASAENDEEHCITQLLHEAGVEDDIVIDEKLPEFELSENSDKLLDHIIAEYDDERDEMEGSAPEESDSNPEEVVEEVPPATSITEAMQGCRSILKYCKENGLVAEEAHLLAFLGRLRVAKAARQKQTSILAYFQ